MIQEMIMYFNSSS